MWLSLLIGLVALTAGLMVIPPYGFRAIPFLVVCVELALFLSHIAFTRQLGYRRLYLRQLIRPALAAAAMALLLGVLPPMHVLAAIPIGTACYAVLLILLKALGDQERQIMQAVSARLFPRRDAS